MIKIEQIQQKLAEEIKLSGLRDMQLYQRSKNAFA